MTKKEFIQQASIQIAAALVKVYDETAEGLLDDIEKKSCKLASDATTLAFDLAEEFEEEFLDVYECEGFDFD